MDACILFLSFESVGTLSEAQTKVCFNTPAEFVTGANFPTRSGWVDMQRTMFLGVRELSGMRAPSAMTQDGNFINGPSRRIVAQNSLSLVNTKALEQQKV